MSFWIDATPINTHTHTQTQAKAVNVIFRLPDRYILTVPTNFRPYKVGVSRDRGEVTDPRCSSRLVTKTTNCSVSCVVFRLYIIVL